MELKDLVNFIIDIVKKKNLNKVYICGNGSSGKTTLSKVLYDKASMIGTCNLISLDDYLVDINLRKNSYVLLIIMVKSIRKGRRNDYSKY